MAYDWPGNVRELRNAIESLVVLCRGDTIELAQLPANIRQAHKEKEVVVSSQGGAETSGPKILLPSGTSLQDAEKLLIQETLRNNENNISKAARILNISRRTLHRKLHEYHIDLARREPRPG